VSGYFKGEQGGWKIVSPPFKQIIIIHLLGFGINDRWSDLIVTIERCAENKLGADTCE
jgi:hypothetical protein